VRNDPPRSCIVGRGLNDDTTVFAGKPAIGIVGNSNTVNFHSNNSDDDGNGSSASNTQNSGTLTSANVSTTAVTKSNVTSDVTANTSTKSAVETIADSGNVTDSFNKNC
jgi:hypothetical protein